MPSRVSIIIVKYRAAAELAACLPSLKKYHVIIVDNDKINRGYAAGNNLGAKSAKGEYLLILNPDTVVSPGAIELLATFLDTHPQAGIVAPFLLDPAGRPYPLQGTRELTPLTGLVALSFLNQIPNPISRHYWLADWDKRQPRQVDVVPGTAFLIRKQIYDQLGGFDENFFLYFEEADLCRRVRHAGWEIYMYPPAKIMHYWGASTPKSARIQAIFSASRFYYFRKHFGLLWAIVVHLVCSFSLLWLAVILGAALRFYRFPGLMPFIGDQAWYYLAARDALLGGRLPLLGITASITWLHQGPLWTYLLVPLIAHPVLPAILTSIMGVVSVYLIYFLGGWPASLLLAVLPLAVLQSRMPYHTSLIPLFSILFLLFLRRHKDFLAGLFLGFLYQLHLLTFIFWPIMFWRRRLIPGFILGILPFLLVGPVQTFGILAWIAKHSLAGFGGSTISTAYLVVLLVPAILVVSWFLNRLPKFIGILIIVIYLGFSYSNLDIGSSLSSRIVLSKAILRESGTDAPEIVMSGPGSKFRSYSMPYEYLVWWLSRSTSPEGSHTKFLIHESSQTFEQL
ncbi:MAG: glycosyl transferase family 2 [Candidatus Amesbacteria bacterium GW2011_GWA2_47_70]|uniref:Glycosyl transferase family 2 n=1 Tax=Candidatus Amesbacteria bacterium GW2011_GWC2_45_19 TaxID=1618366 RepID=A0A0G1M5B4_9BACT|nr:MAG: glycosyl transferase family 2 [Candidatus Amesbacteria bacterium GW2011_GWC2_45_19]KKU69425.1 MAG: glycosyl transferase family 2 [Microgenomates group bacterium GW2011_GWC1_47_20]KKU80034.1 MAG: glycosyl transferase family 2 [Candidatus Amesbacteria bacterium GW2011_GWA2_47_70]